MKALWDTHAFVWWLADDPRLSPKVRDLAADPGTALSLSAASAWEIVIKVAVGKLRLPGDPDRVIAEQVARYRIEALPIRLDHTLHVHTLPPIHRDPFDRILVAQARLEGLPILTSDPRIARYPVEVIW